MALIIDKKTKDPLQEVGKTKTVDGIKTELHKESPKLDKIESTKKKGFFRTTFEELLKVDWPSAEKTINWSIMVFLFTVIISITLGFFDHIFSAGIGFVECTSPQARGNSTTFDQCGLELADNLTFRN